MTMPYIPFTTAVLILTLVIVTTGYRLSIQLLSYNNPTNTLSNGSCCVPDCSSCDPVYLFCLRGPGHSLSDSNCPFGTATHAGTRGFSTDLVKEGLMYRGCFQLHAIVAHDSKTGGTVGEYDPEDALIDELFAEVTVPPTPDGSPFNTQTTTYCGSFGQATLEFVLRAICEHVAPCPELLCGSQCNICTSDGRIGCDTDICPIEGVVPVDGGCNEATVTVGPSSVSGDTEPTPSNTNPTPVSISMTPSPTLGESTTSRTPLLTPGGSTTSRTQQSTTPGGSMPSTMLSATPTDTTTPSAGESSIVPIAAGAGAGGAVLLVLVVAVVVIVTCILSKRRGNTDDTVALNQSADTSIPVYAVVQKKKKKKKKGWLARCTSLVGIVQIQKKKVSKEEEPPPVPPYMGDGTEFSGEPHYEDISIGASGKRTDPEPLYSDVENVKPKKKSEYQNIVGTATIETAEYSVLHHSQTQPLPGYWNVNSTAADSEYSEITLTPDKQDGQQGMMYADLDFGAPGAPPTKRPETNYSQIEYPQLVGSTP